MKEYTIIISRGSDLRLWKVINKQEAQIKKGISLTYARRENSSHLKRKIGIRGHSHPFFSLNCILSFRWQNLVRYFQCFFYLVRQELNVMGSEEL